MIEKVIEELVATLPPPDRSNRLGFHWDLASALERCSALREPSVSVTPDPRRIFDVRATVAQSVPSLQDLARELERVLDVVQYLDFRTSSIVWFREATVARFATSPGAGLYLVTGRIEVSGGPYSRLVERFEYDFDEDGPLPTLPPP